MVSIHLLIYLPILLLPRFGNSVTKQIYFKREKKNRREFIQVEELQG